MYLPPDVCIYIYYVHLQNAGYVQHLLFPFPFPFCHTALPQPPFLSPPGRPQADGFLRVDRVERLQQRPIAKIVWIRRKRKRTEGVGRVWLSICVVEWSWGGGGMSLLTAVMR